MKRSKRAELAKETLSILREGFYISPSRRRISVKDALKRSVDTSRLYDGNCSMPALPSPRFSEDLQIEVTAESTFEAVQRHSGFESHVGCLNFASAKNPGGGFLNGSQAQEEAHARSSGLYPTLLANRDYYDRNRSNDSSIYLDLLILSPYVPFLRDDEGQLLDNPVFASVVTAPAPNVGAINHNAPERASEVPPALQRRAELVLRLFAHARVDRLVLGAWGCGVFRNDPILVANTFKRLLEPGSIYARHFRQVTMAVFAADINDPNLTAFRKVFEHHGTKK